MTLKSLVPYLALRILVVDKHLMQNSNKLK
jgi:hypothetical protein